MILASPMKLPAVRAMILLAEQAVILNLPQPPQNQTLIGKFNLGYLTLLFIIYYFYHN